MSVGSLASCSPKITRLNHHMQPSSKVTTEVLDFVKTFNCYATGRCNLLSVDKYSMPVGSIASWSPKITPLNYHLQPRSKVTTEVLDFGKTFNCYAAGRCNLLSVGKYSIPVGSIASCSPKITRSNHHLQPRSNVTFSVLDLVTDIQLLCPRLLLFVICR